MLKFHGHADDFTGELRKLQARRGGAGGRTLGDIAEWQMQFAALERQDRDIGRDLEDIEDITATYQPAAGEARLNDADLRLLGKLESTQRHLELKDRELGALLTVSERQTPGLRRLIGNFVAHKEALSLEQDRLILGAGRMLQATKSKAEGSQSEELVRIRRLEEGTAQVKSMYSRLQNLALEQAQVVDRIDYRLKHAHVNVKKANVELEKLYESYNTLAFSCQAILLFVILGLCLLNFLKHFLKMKIFG